MGQGINTVARQMLCEVAELGPDVAIDITASTEYGAFRAAPPPAGARSSSVTPWSTPPGSFAVI